MTRRSLWSAILLPLVFAACGPGEVVITTEVERMNPDTGEPEMRPIERMEVQLLPFDRDAIFDSLTQAAPRPEPQLPPELIAARDSIQEADQRYREAENRLLALREQLQEINAEMEQYNPAEPRYGQLFNQWNQIDAQRAQAEAARDEWFERYTELQRETIQELDQARVQIENWEDEAFADYGEVVAQRLRETGREILADTTDATGRVTLYPEPGAWWIYARHRRSAEELYWNIRVDVERGEPVEILLNRQNATLREVF